MQRMGLSAAELAAFHRTLRGSYTAQVYVSVQDLDGKTLERLNPDMLDGEVTVDMDAEVTRVLTMEFADPDHLLNLDTDSPDAGALFMDRMLRVHYSVLVPEIGRRVSVPVFTGPIQEMQRTGADVSVTAHGKERMAMRPVWSPLRLNKGMRKSDAIRTILRDRTGEWSFAFPAFRKQRMPEEQTLSRWEQAWPEARKLARSMDRQLFYPGNGRATLRILPRRVSWVFDTGDGGMVMGEPAITYSAEVKNVVEVTGGKPKGEKKRVREVAWAQRSHPLSPHRLGRRGKPRILGEQVEDDAIRTDGEARRRAKDLLHDRLLATTDVAFDARVVPHLDCGDVVALDTDDTRVEFRLRKFTIPLTADGEPTMSVGYLRKSYPNRRRIRR